MKKMLLSQTTRRVESGSATVDPQSPANMSLAEVWDKEEDSNKRQLAAAIVKGGTFGLQIVKLQQCASEVKIRERKTCQWQRDKWLLSSTSS